MGYQLLGVATILLIVQAVVYYVYGSLREWCVAQVACRELGPATLFIFAIGVCVVLWIACVCAFAVLLISFVGIAFLFGLVPPSLLGWLKMWRCRRAEAFQKQTVEAQHPVPKFQFRIQDLWVGAFVFGLIMMYVKRSFQARNEYNNMSLAGAIIVAETISFMIAMDVVRRTSALNTFAPRAAYTALVMVLGVIPPILPFMLMAWKAWRYAQWKGRVNL